MVDNLKILLVDDDADIGMIVDMALRLDPAIEVRVVRSAIEAMEQLASWAPDVCLFDVMMPGTDGLRLLTQVHGAGLTVPTIFITARARTQDLALYKAAGAIGVIAKPFDPLTLASEIRQLLN